MSLQEKVSSQEIISDLEKSKDLDDLRNKIYLYRGRIGVMAESFQHSFLDEKIHSSLPDRILEKFHLRDIPFKELHLFKKFVLESPRENYYHLIFVDCISRPVGAWFSPWNKLVKYDTLDLEFVIGT